MGGYLVQKYLERNTAPAAVLLATMPARGGVRIFNRMLKRHPWRTILMHLTMHTFLQIETAELAREAFFSPDIPAETMARYHGLLQEESYRIGWDMSILDVPRPDRVRKTPMLFLGATRDGLILPTEVAETAEAYGCRAEFFDMAHDMMLEAAWPEVALRIQGWLREQGL
jgi:alpha-beta hydrolase superfamily lysophospholipase